MKRKYRQSTLECKTNAVLFSFSLQRVTARTNSWDFQMPPPPMPAIPLFSRFFLPITTPPSSPLGCRWRMPHQLFSFFHIKPEVTAAALPKTSRRCAGAVTWQPVQMERSPKNKRCLAWNYSGSPESAAVIREEEEEERHIFVNFSAESSATSSSWSADRTVITAYEISRLCGAKKR